MMVAGAGARPRRGKAPSRRRARAGHREPPAGGRGRRGEERHLSLQEIGDCLARDPGGEEGGWRVLLHLVEVCAACRRRYAEYQRQERQVRHYLPRVVVAEAREAEALWKELEGATGVERLRRVREEEEFHLWAFCRLAQRMSLETSVDTPREALELAELALAVWPELTSAYDPDWLEDLRAGALACRANARRALGELDAAETDFKAALEALESGTGSILAAADVAVLLALLWSDQGRPEEALDLLDGAHHDYLLEGPDGGDPEGARKALAMKGCVLRQMGREKESVEVLRRAAEKVGRKVGGREHATPRTGDLRLGASHEQQREKCPDSTS